MFVSTVLNFATTHNNKQEHPTTDNNTQQQYTTALWYIKIPMSRCLRDNLRGQKSLGPLKMSLEMAHKVILPQKKNYILQFLKQQDINSYNLPFQESAERITFLIACRGLLQFWV